MFTKRLGLDWLEQCPGGHNCPQVLEMTDRDFAVAGQNITEEARTALPPGPGIGPDERMVKVPRKVMLAALAEIVSVA
jgi:hypothetical protein